MQTSPFFFFGDNSHKQEQFFRNNVSLFMHAVIPLYLEMKLSMFLCDIATAQGSLVVLLCSCSLMIGL